VCQTSEAQNHQEQEIRDGETNVMGWDLDQNWGTAGT